MYIKALFARFIITVAIAVPLLGITSFVSNIHDYEVFATHMDTATSQETTVLHQAIIASSPSPQIEPRPNERLESVVVLPYRSDGSVYKGVLTFGATKPVEDLGT